MRFRPKFTYANVMATIAVFIALGGVSYAALKLPKNSVGTKQLKKNAVTAKKIKKNAIVTAKLKNRAITAAKVKSGTLTGTQIDVSTLGTVPSAQTANTLTALEGVHVVGAPGEPPFAPGANGVPAFGVGVNLPPVGFYRDHDGIVHLEGVAKSTAGEKVIFTLPPGFRPPSGTTQFYIMGSTFIFVAGSNVNAGPKDISGEVVLSEESAPLSGITFRAES